MDTPRINIHEDLINRCKAGERSAQNQLYGMYVKSMYNTARRIVQADDEAEDIVVESFLSAFQNMSQYRGDSTFGAWLKRIVVNNSLNKLKKRKLDVMSINEEEKDIPETPESVSEESLILSVERIKQAVELLPKGFRLVFTLYQFEGYDHKEIGEILDISESTSKSQYNRAKAKLRNVLSKEVIYE